MKKTIFKKLHRPIAMVASFALAFSMFGTAGCASVQDASIDDDEVAMAETAEEAAEDAEAELTIIANAANIKSDSGKLITYYYPDIKVINKGDKNIRSITIQFTSEIESGDSINLDVNGVSSKFTLFGNKTGNKSVNSVSQAGLPASEWETYLKEHLTITLNRNENMVKGLRMIASLSPVSRTLDYNSANGHYYELVSKTVSWHTARYEASQKSYLGMRGYLANITSAEENRILGSLSGVATWIGATCWPDFIATQDTTPASAFNGSVRLSDAKYRALADDAIVDTRAGAINTSHNYSTSGGTMKWYWVTGPEAYEKDANGNLKTDANGNIIYKPQYFCTGTAAANQHNNSVLVDAADTSKGYRFANWSDKEPNNSSCEYVAHLLTTAPTTDPNNKFWNDFSAGNTNATAYLVEYGGLEDTDLAAAGKEVKQTNVDANVDVFVKLDIDIDTSGRTMTTTVDDITVGDNVDKKLNVIESVNGDLDIKKTNPDGTTETVKPTRTYYIKDDTATGGWRELTAAELNENGEPFHAGTYKLQSTAVNAYDSLGQEVLYRGGTATFKIKPKNLDLTAAAKPLVTKTYDGTTAADTTKIDISSLVLPNADVQLQCAATGTFNAVSVKDATKVTLTGVSLTGANKGDYNLDTVGENKAVDVKAAITPRDLKLTTTSNVSWGLAGEEVLDASGKPLAPATNLAIHKTTATQWAPNELAWRDAHSLTDTILGDLTFEPRCSSVVLDEEDPTAGLYTVNTFFANVNPNVKASNTLNTEGDEEEGEGIDDDKTPMASMSLMEEGVVTVTNTDVNEAPTVVTETTRDINVAPTVEEPVNTDPLDEITATKLEDGRYDIGNYILSIDNPSILITADPIKEGDFAKVSDFIDGVITETAAKKGTEMTEGDILKLVEQVGGEGLPEGAPSITITKDGKPVDEIDPSEVGTYAIVATYPGNPDTVVRVAYNIAASEPLISNQSVKVAENDKAEPVTKEDLDKLVKGRLKTWIPEGDDPVVTISKEGESFEEIDLSEPGTYNVTLTYMDDEGTVREVRLAYEVVESEEGTPAAQEQIKLPTVDEGEPISKDDLVKKAEDTYGPIIPEDVEPIVTITRDGQPVDEIDPTIPGVYEVTVTYPGTPGEDDDDPGTEDVVIKTVYTYYEEPKPAADEPGDGDKTPGLDEPAGDVTPEVRVPVHDGAPISKEEVEKEILKQYPDLIPDGAHDVKVTITDPEGNPVDAIDPSVPGTYTVVTTYVDDEGVEHTSMTTYTVYDPDNDPTNNGAGFGDEEGMDRQAQGTDPSTGDDYAGYDYQNGDNGQGTGAGNGSGTAGAANSGSVFSGLGDSATRVLAHTGDPMVLAVGAAAAIAAVAGAVLVIARRKASKKQ